MAATLFAACIARLGLSQSEAATLLSVPVNRIKDMSAGRSRVPVGMRPELRVYEARIVDRSETIREVWEDNPAPVIDAVVDDAAGLTGLADFVLNHDVLPGNVQVGIVRE